MVVLQQQEAHGAARALGVRRAVFPCVKAGSVSAIARTRVVPVLAREEELPLVVAPTWVAEVRLLAFVAAIATAVAIATQGLLPLVAQVGLSWPVTHPCQRIF